MDSFGWISFVLFLIIAFYIDLKFLRKDARDLPLRTASIISAFWITLSLSFNLLLLFVKGEKYALDFFTAYIIEKSLSIDNLFLFLVIFDYFKVPSEYQPKVLSYGTISALFFRALFIFLGLTFVSSFHFATVLLGAFLIYSGFTLLKPKKKEFNLKENFLCRMFSKFFRITEDYAKGDFFIKKDGILMMTPLFTVLLLIETTDIIFALDSIPAVFAITLDPFIVFSSNALAVLGLRSLYFVIASSIGLFKNLHYGISALLIFVGTKMVLQDIYPISTLSSLLVIALILATTFLLSLILKKRKKSDSYLHVLNLDTVGGVEELFVNFLVAQEDTIEHTILVTGDAIHPFFRKKVQKAQKIFYEKYLFGMKIPKVFRFLRTFNKTRSLNSASAVILWNRFEDLNFLQKAKERQSRIIYYEHGASWIEPITKNKTTFFSFVDSIIANSKAAKRVLELKWNIKKQIYVIPNPLRPDLVPKNGPKKLQNSTITCGYIGRLISLKGIPLAIEAIHLLNKEGFMCHLKIAGDGPLRKELETFVKNRSLEEKVEFLGCISNVSEFYDSIDVLLVPSIREPLGLVAQEAAIRGCPVIATNVDGLCEVIQNEISGFLIDPKLPLSNYEAFTKTLSKLPDLVYDPTRDTLCIPKIVDPHDIKRAIEFFLKNKESFETMSIHAIQFAKKRPQFEEYCKNLSMNLNSIDRTFVSTC